MQLQQHISVFLHDERVKLLKKVLAGHCTNCPIFFLIYLQILSSIFTRIGGGGVIINTLHFRDFIFFVLLIFLFSFSTAVELL